jgi:hypothetical protein
LGDVSKVYELHSSVKRLLNLALEGSTWLGVRGPYTASVLNQNGFKNVVPIGCPTIYWNMKSDFDLKLKEKYVSPLVVYHRSIAKDNFKLIKPFRVMGQDFQDEAIFTNNLVSDEELLNTEKNIYSSFDESTAILNHIKDSGFFPSTFDDWFSSLASADFVFGPRLHGVIGSLIQGVPALLTTRDLRTREMAEVFNIPSIEHDRITGKSFQDIIKRANFNKFIETYEKRYINYTAFIAENKLGSNLKLAGNYNYTMSDLQTTHYLNGIQLMSLKKLESERLSSRVKRGYVRLNSFVKRVINT